MLQLRISKLLLKGFLKLLLELLSKTVKRQTFSCLTEIFFTCSCLNPDARLASKFKVFNFCPEDVDASLLKTSQGSVVCVFRGNHTTLLKTMFKVVTTFGAKWFTAPPPPVSPCVLAVFGERIVGFVIILPSKIPISWEIFPQYFSPIR